MGVKKMLNVMPVKNHHLKELYNMMVLQNFPEVPHKFSEAEPYLKQTKNYGIFCNNRLQAGFIFGEIENGGAFFDVVCARNFQGKWATFATLRQLYDIAFNDLKLNFVWSEPHSKRALKAALMAGFNYTMPVKNVPPLLVLTPQSLRKKFKK